LNALPTVLIDTREQRPWLFPPDRFLSERRGLPTGDYTLAGFEERFCIERKSLGDFVSTVIGDWLRFRKELIRMSGFDLAAVVVECNVADVREHKYESQAVPESVLGRAHAIYFDHGIPVFFWGPRIDCEQLVHQFMAMAVKKLGT
jgi:DNA excision repair protein ERCC-4